MTRTVIVVDRELPTGLAANAAAVVALSLGAALPHLPGGDFTDAAGETHRGLIPFGLPVLGARPSEMARLRREAGEHRDVVVVDFPALGHTTNDYEEFQQRVAGSPAEELLYAGIGLHGPFPVVRELTRRLSLLRDGARRDPEPV
ncbi:MAG TPA: DUF2000 domain-containing protein [Candidatus Dormibacteraeota bacterium]|jgi:hypothetical protein|nr:DUF2000 domain-containing protein [Candidatus Dormibacteraeota bacterium]